MSPGLAVLDEGDLTERIAVEVSKVRTAPDETTVDHLEDFHARSWAYWSRVDPDHVRARVSAAVLDYVALRRSTR